MTAPNAEMRTQWNDRSGPHWVAMQPRLDAQLAPVSDAILDGVALAPDARVLDVGCGTGALSLAVASRVPAGRVVGADLSAPMLARARERAAAQGLVNTSFVEADAQVADLDGPYDLVVSRFGVMFFDDPVAAFANLLRATRVGGALRFVCWQPAARNPWVMVPLRVAEAVLGPQQLPAPDAPGPFAFGDDAKVLRVLTDAGWRDARVEPWEHPLALGGGGSLDDAAEFLTRIGPTARAMQDAPEELRAAVTAGLRDALAPHLQEGGPVLGGAMWRVSARRAG
ncbi:MAG: class I SAM-dependent methyltransferase [Polyangiales bacterium]